MDGADWDILKRKVQAIIKENGSVSDVYIYMCDAEVRDLERKRVKNQGGFSMGH